MYEVKQAQVARAVDVLRAGPMTAAAFAVKMWPDRVSGRTPGQHSKMGHGLLQRLGQLNYVERVGDLWMVKRFDGAPSGGAPGVSGDVAAGLVGGPPAIGPHGASPVGPHVGSASGPVDAQSVRQAERQRLARLVQQANDPVSGVTHDAALGDLAVRGFASGGWLLEASAIVVLLGRSANVYPPCGAPRMLVALQPAEGARALFLRWGQSGQPPEIPRPGAWIHLDDGIAATPGFWAPAGAPAGWVDPEDVRARIGRLRAAEGIG